MRLALRFAPVLLVLGCRRTPPPAQTSPVEDAAADAAPSASVAPPPPTADTTPDASTPPPPSCIPRRAPLSADVFFEEGPGHAQRIPGHGDARTFEARVRIAAIGMRRTVFEEGPGNTAWCSAGRDGAGLSFECLGDMEHIEGSIRIASSVLKLETRDAHERFAFGPQPTPHVEYIPLPCGSRVRFRGSTWGNQDFD